MKYRSTVSHPDLQLVSDCAIAVSLGWAKSMSYYKREGRWILEVNLVENWDQAPTNQRRRIDMYIRTGGLTRSLMFGPR